MRALSIFDGLLLLARISIAGESAEWCKAVSSHEEFMYACAIAYAATGDIDAAKDTLTLILNKKPQLKNDARFQQTVQKTKHLSGDKLK